MNFFDLRRNKYFGKNTFRFLNTLANLDSSLIELPLSLNEVQVIEEDRPERYDMKVQG